MLTYTYVDQVFLRTKHFKYLNGSHIIARQLRWQYISLLIRVAGWNLLQGANIDSSVAQSTENLSATPILSVFLRLNNLTDFNIGYFWSPSRDITYMNHSDELVVGMLLNKIKIEIITKQCYYQVAIRIHTRLTKTRA